MGKAKKTRKFAEVKRLLNPKEAKEKTKVKEDKDKKRKKDKGAAAGNTAADVDVRHMYVLRCVLLRVRCFVWFRSKREKERRKCTDMYASLLFSCRPPPRPRVTRAYALCVHVHDGCAFSRVCMDVDLIQYECVHPRI